jgi:hypothetical protein
MIAFFTKFTFPTIIEALPTLATNPVIGLAIVRALLVDDTISTPIAACLALLRTVQCTAYAPLFLVLALVAQPTKPFPFPAFTVVFDRFFFTTSPYFSRVVTGSRALLLEVYTLLASNLACGISKGDKTFANEDQADERWNVLHDRITYKPQFGGR